MLGKIVMRHWSPSLAGSVRRASINSLSFCGRRQLQTASVLYKNETPVVDEVPVATAKVTIKEGSALQQVQELDTRAERLYLQNPLCFRNFPVEKIKWRVATNHRGMRNL